METKRFVHDCNHCIYLGQYEEFDLYWCKNKTYPRLDSVIARYSSEGSNYISSHPPGAFADPLDYLRRADRWYHIILSRAKELGLYDHIIQGPNYKSYQNINYKLK